MTRTGLEDTLSGIGLSPGIVIGRVKLIDRRKMQVCVISLEDSEIEGEIKRFEDAVEKSKKQLSKIKERIFKNETKDHFYIIDTHLMMLDDQMLIEDTIGNIRREKVNAEWALTMVVDELKKIFSNLDDIYMRERGGDVSYIGDTILRNLVGKKQENISKIDEKVVVVAHDLSPADTAQMNKDNIIGFATDIGGKTSHSAIIARALEIPAVGGLEDVSFSASTGDHIIVDGLSGKVIINPSDETFREYLDRQQKYEYKEKEIHEYSKLAAETLDGKRIHVGGNIEIVEEIPSLINNGGEGIGLYRTEFLYMNRDELPSESDHLNNYKEVLEKVSPHPVTIRTLDIGMDKIIPYFETQFELNPALGLRSIRFCLKEKDVFKTQLRAILRASAFSKLRIMYPMISGVEEVHMANEVLDEARAELDKEGLAYDKNVETGIMIEVPSAAVVADILAREVDFFSIGTNDLIQYSLAIDRVNEQVAYLYEPMHPAILRTIKNVIDAGHDEGITVGMCGEMAGDPIFAVVLLGFGLDELSMSSFSIPRVKKLLRNINYSDAKEIAKNVMSYSSAAEIKAFLHDAISSCLHGEFWEELDY